jgi:hypothetical protein
MGFVTAQPARVECGSSLIPSANASFSKRRTNFRDLRHSAIFGDAYALRVSKGIVMNNDKEDVVTLIELLKMADERRVHLSEISLNEPFIEDFSLLEMWAEACRRTGVGTRAFPPKVLELWKQSLGGVN